MNDWMTVWINYNEVERIIIIIKFCLSLKHICTKVFLLISLRFLAEVTSDRDVAASAAEADSEEDNAFGADAAGWWVDRGGAVREESGGGSSTMTDLSTSYLDLLQTPPSSSLCRCHRTTTMTTTTVHYRFISSLCSVLSVCASNSVRSKGKSCNLGEKSLVSAASPKTSSKRRPADRFHSVDTECVYRCKTSWSQREDYERRLNQEETNCTAAGSPFSSRLRGTGRPADCPRPPSID